MWWHIQLTDTNRSKTWPMVYGPIWYFYLVFRVQNMKNCVEKSTSRKSGDNSEEVTPVPISNTVVKLLSADDTWWEAAWESRTLPVFYYLDLHKIEIKNCARSLRRAPFCLPKYFYYFGDIACQYFRNIDKSTLRSGAHGWAPYAHRNLRFRDAHFCLNCNTEWGQHLLSFFFP